MQDMCKKGMTINGALEGQLLEIPIDIYEIPCHCIYMACRDVLLIICDVHMHLHMKFINKSLSIYIHTWHV